MKKRYRYIVAPRLPGASPAIVVLLLFSLHCISQVAAAAADSDHPEQTQLTQDGSYRITVRPQAGSVPVSKTHNWVIHVETTAGETFIPTQLFVMAGMPAHGHGMPSEPRVTRHLENGDFLVEGMTFNMTGLWQIVVSVNGPAGPDQVMFELNLRNAAVKVSKSPEGWSDDELRTLNALRLKSLEPPRKDVSNRLSGNRGASRLGKALFFDRNLSARGTVACADCHDPSLHFTDGKTLSFGSHQTARHSPSLLGAAYSQWFYWDGRRDSLWAQAVTPIETLGEMDNARVDAVRYVMANKGYGPSFSKLSEALDKASLGDRNRFPDGAGPYANTDGKQAWEQMSVSDQRAVSQAFSDIGKVLAAYVETLRHRPSRFDQFADRLLDGDEQSANNLMTREERLGLKLFLNENRVPCLRCHNGPLFSNHEFQNIATGVSANGSLDFGRFVGLQATMVDEFNCRGRFSDTTREQCDLLKHAAEGHLDQGAFKVPSLRNVAVTAPYMHDGRFSSLQEVISHYRDAANNKDVLHEIPRFAITDEEASEIVAFLGTLTGEEVNEKH